jgi:serine/threonine protein kinase/Flp pilus assembly protein TadD
MVYEPGCILLGKYEFLELLGIGGWGNVYKALDLKLGREVAIKHLRTDLTKNEVALKRFLIEAKTIAGLKHPNIVTIYALEQDGDDHYIVMEYAEQGTLEKLLEVTGPLAIDQVVDIATSVGQALELVHSRGIIHRDIKPSNILLFADVEEKLLPKLADFGLVRTPPSQKDPRLTDEHTVMGTVAYMSPEQALGEEVDSRSDIYSLGALLYMALTGKVPYEGSFIDVLNVFMGQTKRNPTPINSIRQDVSDVLNNLVMKALSIDAARRFQTARAMAESFQALRGDIIVTHRPDELERLYQMGLHHSQKGEWGRAVSAFGQLIRQVPDYKDAERKWEEAREQDALQTAYERGLRYFEKEQWENSAASFKDILSKFPGYRDAEEKLHEANRQINLRTLYERASVAVQTSQWQDAVKILEEIVGLDRNYRDVTALLDQARIEYNLETWYKEGVDHFITKSWHAALTSFERIRKQRSNYKDVDNLFEEATKQVKLEDMYQQGREYEAAEQWGKAREVYGQILGVTNYQYRDADKRLADVNSIIQVEDDFKKAQVVFEKEQWSQAINLLENLLERKPDHQKCLDLLSKARSQRKLKILYDQATAYEAAEEWDSAVKTWEDIKRIAPDYLDVTGRLSHAQQRQGIEALYAEGREYLRNGKYKKASQRFNQVLNMDPNHQRAIASREEAEKLLRRGRDTEERREEVGFIRSWWRSLGGSAQATVIAASIALIGGILAAIVGPFSTGLSGLIFNPTATPTPTLSSIPSIDRVEVFMARTQLNLNEVQSLTRGQTVELEVVVVDTDGNTYASDDLVCKWSITPLGNQDVGIDTDLCRTLYIPSHEYSTQTVIVKVEGLTHQFESGDPISIKFNIMEEQTGAAE